MAREYIFSRTITNPVTARDLLQLVPAAAIPIVVLRASITQRDSATSAQLGAQLNRKSAAATVTAAVLNTDIKRVDPADAGSTAQLGTALTGYTATTAGTDGDLLVEEGWNTLNGFFWLPVPEERITIPGGGIFGLRLNGTVPAGVYIATLVFAEGISG